jgi:hypothetical protein
VRADCAIGKKSALICRQEIQRYLKRVLFESLGVRKKVFLRLQSIKSDSARRPQTSCKKNLSNFKIKTQPELEMKKQVLNEI